MHAVKVGLNNLIESTMEIVSYFFARQKNEEIKKELQNLVDRINELKYEIPRYHGREARGHFVNCEQSVLMEALIKEVLLKIFDIDMGSKKQRISQSILEEYRRCVGSLLDKVIKCESKYIQVGIVIPSFKGNERIKRTMCRCVKISYILDRSKLLSVEEFRTICSELSLDSSALETLMRFCSTDLILGIVNLRFIQLLASREFFPPESNDITINMSSNYDKLINHIVLYCYSRSIHKYYTNKMVKGLPYLSVTSELKINSVMPFALMFFLMQVVFSIFGSLFILLHVNNIMNVVDMKNLSIGVCVGSAILGIVSVTLVSIGYKKLHQDNVSSLHRSELSLESFYVPGENIDL
ncbi:putative integral membrane protein [Ehrlichia ruminantium]|nr:hypothetical protein [Ehrlichia ruminantium]KYW91761.1 hypothetical protein AUR40_00465 [Ehrlichia ruminantium]QLK52558.1 hypothetical protein FDZ65_03535 [Ehrlichia ruminantium]QLK54388.1 hypothetical protein FDZ63_03535 [Ehrlichia ruminantium]QLK57139.1 hypothetical protein FDZ60_03545 [Ehrlichia ruminantium]GAT76481.1 putative integral membrane protein [Ehrlichia ruminantium]